MDSRVGDCCELEIEQGSIPKVNEGGQSTKVNSHEKSRSERRNVI